MNLIGQRFGRLVVLSQAATMRYSMWRCRCDCGNEATVSRQMLMMGERGTRSCGCLRREQQRANLLRLHAEGRLRRAAPTIRYDASALLAAMKGLA